MVFCCSDQAWQGHKLYLGTGGAMFTTRHGLRSWWRDLNLFFSEIYRGESSEDPMQDRNKPNTLETVNPGPKNLQANQSRLGASLLVKGEISGKEDLLIDGSVEGTVQLDEQKLTIGPTATVKADIIAGEVLVSGNLRGSIRAKGRIEIRNDGSVTGDLTTPQIFIEDGAWFKGSIEIDKSAEKETNKNILSEIESKSAKVTAIGAGLKSA